MSERSGGGCLKWVGLTALVAGLLAIFGIYNIANAPPAPNRGWIDEGGPDNGFIKIISIKPGYEKSRAVYEEAMREVCRPGKCVYVGFFAQGSRIPDYPTRKEFFERGGWASYYPLAVYLGDHFTRWDCVRAGAEEAPPSALCDGEGMEEYKNNQPPL